MSDPNPHEEPNQGKPPVAPEPVPSKPEPKPEPKGVSQAEHDRAIEAAKKSAAKQAQNEIDAFFAEQKRLQDEAAMDEAGRAKAEADRLKQEAAADRAAAAEMLHAAKVRAKLSVAGVPETALDRAVNLVTVSPGATDEEIDADIKKLKDTDVPALFAVQAPPAGGGPGVKPGNRPPGGQPPPSGIEAGRAKAREEAEAAKSINPLDRFQRVGGPVGGT
jgi:hypothetical protein